MPFPTDRAFATNSTIQDCYARIENRGVEVPLAPSAYSVVRLTCWRMGMDNFYKFFSVLDSMKSLSK